MAAMSKYFQDGRYIDYTPGADVAAGDVVVVGSVVGIAADPIPANRKGALDTRGVYIIPKKTTVAVEIYALGDILYWDSVAKKVTNVPDNAKHQIGWAIASQIAADVNAFVLLRGFRKDADGDTGLKVVSGQQTTVAASDTVATGLTKVLAAVANLEDVPVIGADRAQAVIGDQAGAPVAGSILVKTFKPTAAGDATPIAATTFGKKVNWIAFGY